MEEILNNLEKALNDEDGLFLRMRLGKNIDEEKVESALKIIKQIGLSIKNEKLINKRIPYLLIDIVPSMLGCVELYNSEDQKKLTYFISLINDEIVECFN